MKVSGFSFIRNAIKFDYPVKESITSVLPVVDEFIIATGKSEDKTLELIRSIDSDKIKIIETVWDESLRKGGRVLAAETNKAFGAIAKDSDWAFYIQGDEVVHERDLTAIQQSMEQWKDHPQVEGLLFNYLHFYGSYDYIGNSRRWYRKEVRIIRNDQEIYSFRDAQGFQKKNRPLKVKPANAAIHHYGWVKHPSKQQVKQQEFNKLWHSDEWIANNIPTNEEFDYSGIDSLAKFKGSHPDVMSERIKKSNWKFQFDLSKKNFILKHKVQNFIEQLTGWRMGEYKNYKLLR